MPEYPIMPLSSIPVTHTEEHAPDGEVIHTVSWDVTTISAEALADPNFAERDGDTVYLDDEGFAIVGQDADPPTMYFLKRILPE